MLSMFQRLDSPGDCVRDLQMICKFVEMDSLAKTLLGPTVERSGMNMTHAKCEV
jgi:hypothetical protein